MYLLDVNILVQVHREDAPEHMGVTQWLMNTLAQTPGIAVSELVLSGVLRVITHPRVFKEPTPLDQALAFVEDFRSRPQVQILAPDEKHWPIFQELCQRADARGNHIPDAYHAALAIEYGCQWVTLDRGFSRYPGLNWLSPL